MAGFTNTGNPSSSAARSASNAASMCRRRHALDSQRHLGDAGRAVTTLATALSMHSAEAEHPGADVGDAGQLEEALHRAVLAHRAVEEGEHHHLLGRLPAGDVVAGSRAGPAASRESGRARGRRPAPCPCSR